MRYKVLSQLNTGNTLYKVGDSVELSEDEAKQLQALGVVEPERKPFSIEIDVPGQ